MKDGRGKIRGYCEDCGEQECEEYEVPVQGFLCAYCQCPPTRHKLCPPPPPPPPMGPEPSPIAVPADTSMVPTSILECIESKNISSFFLNEASTSQYQAQKAIRLPKPKKIANESSTFSTYKSEFKRNVPLPKFSDDVLEAIQNPPIKRFMWKTFIDECALFYVQFDHMNTHDMYQAIAKKMWQCFPSITLGNDDRTPWKYFSACLSRKIRKIRHVERNAQNCISMRSPYAPHNFMHPSKMTDNDLVSLNSWDSQSESSFRDDGVYCKEQEERMESMITPLPVLVSADTTNACQPNLSIISSSSSISIQEINFEDSSKNIHKKEVECNGKPSIKEEFKMNTPLPTFSPLVFDAIKNNSMSQSMWRAFIDECAAFYIKYEYMNTYDMYSAVARKMWEHFPSIAMGTAGKTPWKYFSLCLSRKIRNMRTNGHSQISIIPVPMTQSITVSQEQEQSNNKKESVDEISLKTSNEQEADDITSASDDEDDQDSDSPKRHRSVNKISFVRQSVDIFPITVKQEISSSNQVYPYGMTRSAQSSYKNE